MHLYPRINPDVGTPVPAVTKTCSTPSTWLTEVPPQLAHTLGDAVHPWM
ncbi:Uncharacterised protein [Mycolicibacterium fortuitum]|uniref:Uncharacterized protein n=1 Tax=Mycolicibacterium fortuitum TaxID=1766 RepID=A0A378UYU3_MYCFO|nr:Uncharacterised protein [Mycolicibacterium fortuitum]